MDKLDLLFEKQLMLQQRLGYSKDSLKHNQKYINLNILALFDELGEVLRETKWKNPEVIEYGWKKTQQFNEELFKEELVDLLHFFINLCIASGMDSTELSEQYHKKNKENHNRQTRNY